MKATRTSLRQFRRRFLSLSSLRQGALSLFLRGRGGETVKEDELVLLLAYILDRFTLLFQRRVRRKNMRGMQLQGESMFSASRGSRQF
jgi:hypothetical protein